MPTEKEANKRQEKEFYPKLIKDNTECVPSLEIAVDHLPKEFAGCSLDELLKHTQEWVEKESFKGKAVLWQWFCPASADFIDLGGPVAAEFVCMIGLPEECRSYVAQKLGKQLGKAFKYPADPLSKGQIKDSRVKDSRCLGYIDDGIVWQSLDACTWL
ncbi:MAG: hypothetical protein WCL71_08005 [Deltaproteobacteria bacterium]